MHHAHGHEGHHGNFEEFYADGPQWSGNPNEALVHEVAGLTPGRVLDIGAGEGADAVWLAEREWRVTALEPASAAVQRVRELAEQHGVGERIDVRPIVLADYLETVGEKSFDLICAFYFPAPVSPEQAEALVGLLHPGGTLLWVDHDFAEKPASRMDVGTMSSLVDGRMSSVELRRSQRDVTHGAGAHHHEDVILRAVR